MSVSVRELVEWVVREGDIDHRRTGAPKEDAMLLGANRHRALQKAAGSHYRAEVPLSYTVELTAGLEEPLFLTVSGRADGVIKEPDENGEETLTVDEIKGVFQDISKMDGPLGVHLAQAEMYAFILSSNEGERPVSVRMTYVQLKEEEAGKSYLPKPDEIRRFSFSYTFDEIREKFFSYIRAYEPWIRFMVLHSRERNASAEAISFPYTYRPGQKTIIGQVYQTVSEGERLFVQAPTGIGKTLAMLYPAVKAMASGMGDKLFYLTAKTVAGRAAIEAIRILAEKGLRFSFIQITAKEKLCPYEKAECDPIRCERAKGHFSRVNEAIYELITKETAIDSDVILSYAAAYRVCPYEFALDVSLFADLIICDYNYVFDPHVYLRRYFAGNETDSVLLVDEAHNLVERARIMYSAELVKEEILQGKRLFNDGKTVEKHLVKLNRLLLEEKRKTDGIREIEPGELLPVYREISTLRDAMNRYFDRHPNPENSEEKLDLFFKISDFISAFEALNDGYLSYAGHTEDGRFYIRLFCIDPSKRLEERISEVRAAVFFSATFLPIRYYKELIAGDSEAKAVYVDSPFDPVKRRLLIARDVSSKYTRRNRTEFERIASYLLQMAVAETGNYLAFFPSHQFLDEVCRVLEEHADGRVSFIRQERVMSEEERASFLREFSKKGGERNGSLVGLSVIGGLFSEGIDLKGDSLIGVAVVGTGLPKVSDERELIRTYYDRMGMNGFDYAYRFPGFTKVLQAAGRLIRTTEDEGVILLLDERFLYRENLSMFPREWSRFEKTDIGELSEKVKDFWRERRSG